MQLLLLLRVPASKEGANNDSSSCLHPKKAIALK
jgi:hypothetical protein